ncbi:MAG: hypothetical protein AAFQ37_12765, partial [Bacteroidota bacterium]
MPLRTSFVFVFFLLVSPLFAEGALTLFIDGPIDRILLKQQLDYVNHTLDPNTAQVHILVTRQPLGARRSIYQFVFTGQE